MCYRMHLVWSAHWCHVPDLNLRFVCWLQHALWKHHWEFLHFSSSSAWTSLKPRASSSYISFTLFSNFIHDEFWVIFSVKFVSLWRPPIVMTVSTESASLDVNVILDSDKPMVYLHLQLLNIVHSFIYLVVYPHVETKTFESSLSSSWVSRLHVLHCFAV